MSEELDISESEAAVLRQAEAAAHPCSGDDCAWCRIAALVPEILAEVPT